MHDTQLSILRSSLTAFQDAQTRPSRSSRRQTGDQPSSYPYNFLCSSYSFPPLPLSIYDPNLGHHECDPREAEYSRQRISIYGISLDPRYRSYDYWKDGGVLEWNDGSSDDLTSCHQGLSSFFKGKSNLHLASSQTLIPGFSYFRLSYLRSLCPAQWSHSRFGPHRYRTIRT
jgi:hypothetical protein